MGCMSVGAPDLLSPRNACGLPYLPPVPTATGPSFRNMRCRSRAIHECEPWTARVRRQARRLGAKAARRASTGKHEAAVRSAGRFSKSGTCAQAEGDRDPRSPVKEKVDSYKKPDHPES